MIKKLNKTTSHSHTLSYWVIYVLWFTSMFTLDTALYMYTLYTLYNRLGIHWMNLLNRNARSKTNLFNLLNSLYFLNLTLRKIHWAAVKVYVSVDVRYINLMYEDFYGNDDVFVGMLNRKWDVCPPHIQQLDRNSKEEKRTLIWCQNKCGIYFIHLFFGKIFDGRMKFIFKSMKIMTYFVDSKKIIISIMVSNDISHLVMVQSYKYFQ